MLGYFVALPGVVCVMQNLRHFIISHSLLDIDFKTTVAIKGGYLDFSYLTDLKKIYISQKFIPLPHNAV